jgi:hypothetical protein
VSDDLESFFWVLLYLAVKCRGISYEEDMKAVIDQHYDMDDNGNVAGGTGKLFCLRDRELNSSVVKSIVKTPCKDIIEELRALFNDYYRYSKGGLRVPNDPTVNTQREKDPGVLEATTNLSSSEWILKMINGHLSSKLGVDDDSTVVYTRPCFA